MHNVKPEELKAGNEYTINGKKYLIIGEENKLGFIEVQTGIVHELPAYNQEELFKKLKDFRHKNLPAYIEEQVERITQQKRKYEYWSTNDVKDALYDLYKLITESIAGGYPHPTELITSFVVLKEQNGLGRY